MQCRFAPKTVLFVTLCICSVVMQFDKATFAQTEPNNEPPDERLYVAPMELRKSFIEAKPGIAKGVAARQLLKSATPDYLLRFRFDVDDGVALCGAWSRLESQMVARHLGVDSSAGIVDVPDTLTSEFLAFVEGRLRVPPPVEWAAVVRGSRSANTGEFLFPVLTRAAKVYEREYGKESDFPGERGHVTVPHARLTSDNGTAVLTFYGGDWWAGRGARAIVPDTLRAVFETRKVADRPLLISGIAAPGRAIVAIRGEDGPGGDVYCITTVHQGQKPAVLWSASMDAYWTNDFKGSEWFTELRMNNDKVYLFHGTHTSVGIECFLLSDGKRQFSFNTRLPEPFESLK